MSVAEILDDLQYGPAPESDAEARAWLAAERAVPEALPVRDIETRGRAERLLSSVTESAMKSLFSEWLGVDAPRALWQPSR